MRFLELTDDLKRSAYEFGDMIQRYPIALLAHRNQTSRTTLLHTRDLAIPYR